MTDDSNLTPGGEMNDQTSVNVEIRSDSAGHWVKWTKEGESGSLGPYLAAEVAENVRAAKEIELRHNDKPIDEAGA
jgi:hypothetical protein